MAVSLANCCFSLLNASFKLQSSSVSSPCFFVAASQSPRPSNHLKRKSSRSDSSPIFNPENQRKNHPGGIVRDESCNVLHGSAPHQTMAFKAFGSPKKDKKDALPDFTRDQQIQAKAIPPF